MTAISAWRRCCDQLLDESSATATLRTALDEMATLCGGIGGVEADRSFDGWQADTLLAQGVAINPQAAAHCLRDYRRSSCFIRGIRAALFELRGRAAGATVNVLYAGCGPYAPLLLPLLDRLPAASFRCHFLDIHATALASVQRLLTAFGLDAHQVQFIHADACTYRHDAPCNW